MPSGRFGPLGRATRHPWRGRLPARDGQRSGWATGGEPPGILRLRVDLRAGRGSPVGRRRSGCVSLLRRYGGAAPVQRPRPGRSNGRHDRSHHPRLALPAASTRTRTPSATATPDADARPGLEPVTVGTGPLTVDDVVAVARDGAPVVLADGVAGRGAPHPRGDPRAWPTTREPHYGVSTGFGALATRHIPVELRAQLQRSPRPLARRRLRPRGRARGRARADAAAPLDPGHRPHRHPRGDRCTTYVAMLNAGITPVVHEYGSLGCSGDLAPLAHCALALMGEGVVRDAARRARCRAADALAAAGIAPVELAEKEGLALINGTDGMLGMLVPRHPRPARAARGRRRRRGDERRGAARHRRRLRRRPAGAAPAARARPRRPRTSRTVLAHSAIRESHRTEACTRVQDAYSLRCAPQVAGGARDTVDHAAPGRRLGARLRRRQPGRHARRPGRVQRQLPRRAGRLRARLPRDRRRRPRLDLRAAHRPVPRRRAQPRPAAVPRRRPRRRLRPHDRAVHPGRDRLGDEAAGRPRHPSTRSRARRCRRTTSRWAGRPPASCAAPSTGSPACSRSSCSPPPAALELRAPLDARARHRRRRRRPPGAGATPGPGPTATSPPRSRPPYGSSPTARSVARRRVRHRPAHLTDPRRADGCTSDHLSTRLERTETRHGRRPPRPRPARHHPHRPPVADRGPAADADEQPRPRGRRAPRRPRRLRRHRPGRARLGVVRRHGAHPAPRSRPTRRCSCSPAGRSASCGPTSGRRGCSSPTPTWSATGRPGRSSAGSSTSA